MLHETETLTLELVQRSWACQNHYHLVLETAESNLSRGMRQLNSVYSQRFNRRYQRVGHLFQGRYKSIHVDRDSYLLEVIRYVLLNPVRAHMTKTAGQYPWSSYREMIGKRTAPEWLSMDWVLSQYGNKLVNAQKNFIRFVEEGSSDMKVWRHLRHQIYLGDKAFIKRVHIQSEIDYELTDVPRIQKRKVGKDLGYYMQKYKDRNTAIAAAYESGSYTQKQLSDYYGLHYSSISKILKRK